MRFAITTALKDLRRRLADPVALLMWMGLPIVIGGLMNLIGGGDGPAPKAHVLIADEDATLLSRLVTRAGGQSPAGQFLEMEEVTAEEGRRQMDAGKATALLIIPKGFQDAVLRERPSTLTLFTNPSQRILPGIIEEGLKMAAEAAFYAQRIFGQPLQEIADLASQSTTAPSDDVVAAISRLFNQRLRALEGTLSPPVFTLERKTAAPAGESVTMSFGTLFLPGLLFMSLLFTAQGVSIDMWVEKTHGTLRRALTTPQRASALLAGKLAAGVSIMALAVSAALILGVTVLHVPILRVPIALAWACFAGAALLCYLVLLQLVSSSARGAQLLSALIVFPLIMIGGSFFPFEAMPKWMASIGQWTPNGLAVMQVKQILFGQIEWRELLTAAVSIGVPAAAAFVLCVRRLTGTFGTT